MPNENMPQHPAKGERIPLAYARPQPDRDRRLGAIGALCGLVTPSVYLALAWSGRLGLHPGFHAAVAMVLLAFASAAAGTCCSALSLRGERVSGWGALGMLLNVPALFVNCFSLAHVT